MEHSEEKKFTTEELETGLRSFLNELSGGKCYQDLSLVHAEVVQAVRKYQGAGALTLTIGYKPNNGDDSLITAYQINKKVPKPKPIASQFFINGPFLTRNDPKQQQLFNLNRQLDERARRSESAADQTEAPRETVDPTTGEITTPE